MRVGEATNNTQLVEALEKLKQERMNNRRAFEVQWWNNIALVAGDHYAEFRRGEFVEPKKESHQVRLVINQARVVARQELSKITKSRPIMEIMPRSGDEVDIAATRVGIFALDAAEWKFQLRRKRRRALWWTILTGASGIYVGWDANNYDDGILEFVVDPRTGEDVHHPKKVEELKKLEATGEIPALEIESWPLGDIDYKVYSPFQMLPDDTVLDWADIQDIITVDLVEVEKAKDQWPEAARSIMPDSDAKPTGIINRVMRRAGLSATENASVSEDVVQVFTWWLVPGAYTNGFLKDGKMLRWCNKDVILEDHEHCPYADKRLPFAFFTHTPNAVSIWSDCTLTDVGPINLELDKTVSQLLENRDYMVNPMWRSPMQNQLNRIKSQPGGFIKYVHVRDVPPPEQVPGVPLPTQIENLAVGLRDMILDVSGMGEVSRGRVPSGVRAGNMLAFLQEEDETKIGPVSEQFEDGIAQMASLTLSRLSQFYTTERMLRAYRPGGQADVRKFKGADLKGNTDVMVQAGSALPKLKSARQQYVLQLVELGLLKDPKQVKDMLELGDGEPDEVDMAYAQADRENEIMIRSVEGRLQQQEEELYRAPPDQGAGMMVPGEAGEYGAGMGMPEQDGNLGGPAELEMMEGEQPSSFAIPVKSWHLHEAHIQRHRKKMMGAEFEKLMLTHPDVVRLFDEHIAMHQQELQNQMLQQMQMMALAQGGPAEATPPQGAQPISDTAAAVTPGAGGG